MPVKRTTNLEDSSALRRAPSIDIDDVRRNLRWRLALSLLAATLIVVAEATALRSTVETASRPQTGRERMRAPGFVSPPRPDRIMVETMGLG